MKAEVSTFVLIQGNGEVIIPWKGVKDLRGFEWIRSAPDAVAPETREILEATYVDVLTSPIIIMGEKVKIMYMGKETDEYHVAVFQDNNDGKVYDVAKRLADKRKVKKGDKVKLHMLGCCNIMNISKEKKEKKKK